MYGIYIFLLPGISWESAAVVLAIVYVVFSTSLKYLVYRQHFVPTNDDDSIDKRKRIVGARPFFSGQKPEEFIIFCLNRTAVFLNIFDIGLYICALIAISLNDGTFNYHRDRCCYNVNYLRAVVFVGMMIVEVFAIILSNQLALMIQVFVYGVAFCMSPFILRMIWGTPLGYWILGGNLILWFDTLKLKYFSNFFRICNDVVCV